MANAFRVGFAMISDKVNMADLANTKPKKGESMVDYINRWRNLSIKCDRTLTEDETINLIQKNIDGWMGMLLGVTKVNTFKDLLRAVSKMESMSSSNIPSFMGTRPPRRTEAKVAFTKFKDKMVANTNVLGNNANNSSERNSKPVTVGSSQSFKTLRQKKSKSYPFRRNKVLTIFMGALKNGLESPVSKRPEDAEKLDNPNYCPYHRILGHTLEDCWIFKDWIEKYIRNGEITLPKGFLQNPTPHEQVNAVSHESMTCNMVCHDDSTSDKEDTLML
jgi:hypothetical protein